MYLRDIDWSNENINRAGIIPYFKVGKNIFLGFGINQNNTTVTTIGGTYERGDYDLLDTAIREYNEEVGNNLQNITIEDVMGCIGIISKRSIHIFLEIKNVREKSQPTNEFSMLLWITVEQLKIMSANAELTLNHKNTHAFPFTIALKECRNQIFDFFNMLDSFDTVERNITPKRIPKRVVDSVEKTLSEDINKLREDLTLQSKIYHFGLVITEDKFGVILNDERKYILPIDKLEETIGVINKVEVFKCFSCNSDVLILKNKFGYKINKLYSLEKCIIKNTDNNDEAKNLCAALKTLFLEELDKIRRSEDEANIKISNELELINKYERESFLLHSRFDLKYTARARLNFFEKINNINFDIIKHGSSVVKQMKDWEIRVFIDTKFYKYSRSDSLIYI
jgi:hypothetical protein